MAEYFAACPNCAGTGQHRESLRRCYTTAIEVELQRQADAGERMVAHPVYHGAAHPIYKAAVSVENALRQELAEVKGENNLNIGIILGHAAENMEVRNRLAAVTAERDLLKGNFETAIRMKGQVEAQCEAAEAQVAALREALIWLVGTPSLGVGQAPSKSQIDSARRLIANPSPAAERLLTRLASADLLLDRCKTVLGDEYGTLHLDISVWRKAGQS